MAYQFTEDDRNKRVVTAEGHHVGSVQTIDGARARVDRSESDSLTDKIKGMLGWDDDDANEIRDEHVDRSDEDHIYLRQH
ncbi:hypothetical protein C2R22_19115 [Salinigranum rubrum]|uniref:PRC-barrel domain-containing protein n=1 Tax=Salinigranum rubrum TaxID=755307 RepID=A0A2I8VNP1_9EURY|nr:hypothetical protein [Salinigranum rubrum]AUV83494.1 hypothetical protein C2R22_19115 [Salinigranum rubrum]